MSASVAVASGRRIRFPSVTAVRTHIVSDPARAVRILLGLFWVIDGGLQFQPFLYTPDWIQQLADAATGQPQWLASSITWATGLAGADLALWNTLFALTQIGLGLGLMFRRTTTFALAGSLVWAAIVWWLGEAFGMLFMNTASPLTGAPGAVVLYALIALVAWPGGLLGDRGVRTMWAALWVAMGWLWLLPANSGDNSVSNTIAAVPGGTAWPGLAQLTQGYGQIIAIVAAGLSALIGCAVGFRWHARTFLWISIGLNAVYWVVGQGFGGLATGEATDVNSGPLFILLAFALFMFFPKPPAAEPSVGQSGTAAVLSRRTVLTTVGVVGAAAAFAVAANAAGLFGRGGGGLPPIGGPHHGDGNGSGNGNGNGHGDGHSGGAQSQGDPNAGIQMLSSDIALPAQFTSPLPIPKAATPTRQTADTDYFEITQSVASVEIIPGMKTQIWGYNGTFPGPTIVQRPNRHVVVTHRNALPTPTVVHLHGGATPHDSDGYPTDFVLPDQSYGTFPAMPAMGDMPAMTDPDAVVTRLTRDYTYPSQPRAATLWYHDHRMAFTGASVYRGLAGFHIAQDTAEQALPLPRGARDVPLMILDRAFAADGSFRYPALDPTLRSVPGVGKESMNGVMGDVILVNGAPWPVMQVDTARYRFRLLNASNARTYRLALDSSQGTGFTLIGTDQGLLAAPQPLDTIMIAPAQRFDVVIDFSQHKVGDQITLTNQFGSDTTAVVMRFAVARKADDTSSVPATLSTVDPITPDSAMPRRTVKFHRGGDDDWTINGRVFDPTHSEADVKAGSTELWTVSSDFHHPFHIHNATVQVVSRDGRSPAPEDQGWKDTVFVNKGEQVQLAIRFTGYQGRYVFHCHNLEHEDMGMMANFTIG